MKVIGYDVGTTGFKAAIYEVEADSIEFVDYDTRQYELKVLPNGGAEQAPEDWWEATCSSTKELLQRTGIPKEEIKGISFCSQCSTLVLIDKEGNSLRPAMNIMDTRAGKQFKEYFGSGVTVAGANVKKLLKCLKITNGAPLSTKDSVWRYLWVKENEPEIFAKVYKWLDAKEYLTGRATGVYKASLDDAYMTFLYDQKKHQWSETICKMFDVNMDHLPGLCKSTDVVGGLTDKAAEELGLAVGTPVISGGTDISLCQIGSGCVLPGDTNICSGTSGWVCVTTDKQVIDVTHGVASITCADPETYAYPCDCETAGKCMEWVKERLSATPVNTFDEMVDMAATVPAGANGILFSPWMHGNRCPFEDPNTRGLLFNIDVDNHSPDIMKAVIEGVCMHMKWLMETAESKVEVDGIIRFTGGSAIAPHICQVMADVIGKPIEIIHQPRQVGTRGAAAVAAVGLGVTSSLKNVRDMIAVDKVYKPIPENNQVYENIFPVFKDLYKQTKKLYARMNAELGMN